MAITLRNYLPEDFPQLKANLEQAGMYYEDMDGKPLLDRMVAKDPESIVIAADKDKVVGSAYFVDLGFAAMLWRLNVVPEYRKNGIGEQIIEEVKDHAKSRGFSQLHFMVHDGQERLIEWYQELGAWNGSKYQWMGFDL